MAGVKTANQVFRKTPDEVVKKNFEFSGVDLATGETISSVVSTTVTPTGALTATSPVISGTKVQYTLSAGTLNGDYEVKTMVTTSLGQTLDGCGIIEVRAC